MDTDVPSFLAIISSSEDDWREWLPLPAEIYKEYDGLLPRACRLTTIDGEEYEATIGLKNGQLSLIEGWENFMDSESIEYGFHLEFYRHSLFDFEIEIMDENGCEREPICSFTLDMKRTHVERARLFIPMQFWRDHIEGDYADTSVAYLLIGKRKYELEVVEGHGKKLLQRGEARSFMDDNEIVENCSYKFCLVPGELIRFKVYTWFLVD
ncbi:Unknown protein [Striga hermonthica]|uniref:TF-B3 domain-containing protein n=1 Tax=Striga hermonthica TaxID=68872 RepID=A0A9N7R048_STRHE|nr:Unknown protein [Striga hermonthica]